MVPRTIFFLFLFLFGRMLHEEGEMYRVTAATRRDTIRQAKVWHETEVSRRNLLLGPQNEIAVAPETLVVCRFVEPTLPVTGHSPKFNCRHLRLNKSLRVKYGSGEAFAEIASSRLFWALGFYADETYPVRLKCIACPEKNAARPSKDEKRIDRVFEDAMIERNFQGKEIGQYPDQGWAWNELDLVDESSGGSSRAEVDALKLLAVFVQHTDSKRQQQRLGCYAKDIERSGATRGCEKPVMMVQDLGETFGMGGEDVTKASAMNFKGWSEQHIWNQELESDYATANFGKKACFGNLLSADFAKNDGITHPQISEEGRAFLARLLNDLSDKQIRNLFEVARADKTGEIKASNEKVTIDDWVAVFKAKREQISTRRCD